LDVGAWKGERWRGEKIPTLEEVLATVPPGKKVVIELKVGPEIVEPMAKLLAASDLKPEQIVIISFHAETIAACERQLPDLRTHWLTGYKQDAKGKWRPTAPQIDATLDRIHTDGLGSMAVPEYVNGSLLAQLRQGGLKEFHVWTVDDPEVARLYQRLGTWGITTNRPGWLHDQLWPAKEVKTLEINAPAPELDLPGVDGKTYRLEDFADAQVLVVVFTCNHCPTAQAYEARIMRLHADYRDRGVALVAISPNAPQAVRLDELGYTDIGDSFEEMKLHAKRRGFTFPYLYDGDTQRVATAYGALATPHLFIFDRHRNLQYNGRIDNAEAKAPTSHDARNAIDDLLANRPVRVPKTRVFGCSTKWADKRESARKSMETWNAEPVELQSIDESGLRALAANKTDNFRLINLWSTTCAPCITELPEFVTVNRMYRRRNFEMLTLTTDPPDRRDAALKVLRANHVSCTNYIFDSDDRDRLADALDPHWEGPVPYTILIAPGGEIVCRWKETIDPARLKAEIVQRLGRTYTGSK
ncbi:MAG: redoxin domain-containing protein, partial [Pirellulales bacterium]